METARKTYYDILEIETSATHQDIHGAYQRAKNAYSGNSVAMYSLMSAADCEAVVEQIEEAYSILGDPEKRKEYDDARGINISDPFETQTLSEKIQEVAKPEIEEDPMASYGLGLNDMVAETQALATEKTNDHSIKAPVEELEREKFNYTEVKTSKEETHVSKATAFNKYSLSFEKNYEFEQEIENTADFTGSFLKKIREYKDVSIERLADMTRISKTQIKNIEAEEFSKLPADVYTRGFVHQYAKCLKLNPELVATSYIHHLRKIKNPE